MDTVTNLHSFNLLEATLMGVAFAVFAYFVLRVCNWGMHVLHKHWPWWPDGLDGL